MPDQIPPAGAPAPKTPEELAAHNAEVARKVADQDVLAKPSSSDEFGEASGALDKLAAQVQPKPDAPKPDATPKPDAPKVPDIKPDAPKPDAPPQPTPEEIALQKRAEDLFKDTPGLPPNASPKSAESFAKVKTLAAQEISKLEQERDALKKQIEEVKKPSEEQVKREQELEELRQFRQRLDVEFDPKFKEFDKTVAQHQEFIYAQLLKSPNVTPAVIEQIKKYGGPEMVDMSKLLESVKDPTIKRLVENRLADIEQVKFNREQAVTEAKANLAKYSEERQTALSRQDEEFFKATAGRADKILGTLDWIAEKQVTTGMDEAAKKEVTEHNEFIGTLKSQMVAAIRDRSPEMHGILVAGMAQLFNLQRRLPVVESQLASVTKERDEAVAKYEKIKNASRSRLESSQAPSGGIPQPPKGVDVNSRTGDALDAIAKRVMEERAAKGV
jgi:hypothetical protein